MPGKKEKPGDTMGGRGEVLPGRVFLHLASEKCHFADSGGIRRNRGKSTLGTVCAKALR